MRASKSGIAATLGLAVLIALALATWAWPREGHAKPALGLFTSLPIYWKESASVGEALGDGGTRHWVREALESEHRLVLLDTLDSGELAKLDSLVMAQPRPLAPQENVALDDWVRGGGRVLLFADPLLTEHSWFAIGDRRRPQDVILLSPILRRWGLELTFDEDQADGERLVAYHSASLPERMSGRLRTVGSEGDSAQCAIESGGLVAQCGIGKGSAVVVADAALLEADRQVGPGKAALEALMLEAFVR
ncbi:hypothetical protein GCM10011515_17780 [Tsuneonella deserti]|uniref:ABC transporter n=1 Tax=Tsuneonella deserti TaxID=2035528 RepID=A0ABQ1SAE2_9SPHN|nr:DUF4350 domain-containing protein [Tsuneonella deserti]GGD98401.1 hypothetical protein GCM10011515_17780 [Tsuneonella deserti]